MPAQLNDDIPPVGAPRPGADERDARLERLARLARTLLGATAAQIALPDGRRWLALAAGTTWAAGLDGFSAALLADGAPLLVPDAGAEARFAAEPLVSGPAQVRFCAGHPIAGPDGRAIGALAVYDQRPRGASPEQLAGLGELAALAAQELAPAGDALDELLLSSTLGVVMVDDGRAGAPIVGVNPAFERLIGRSGAELIGRPHATIYRGAADGGADAADGAALRLARPDGRTLWVQRRLIRHGAAGERLLVAFDDVTGQVKVERERRLMLEVAQAMAGQRELGAALRELLRLMAERSGWRYAEAWLPAGAQLRRAASWGVSSPSLAALSALSAMMAFRPGEGLPGRVWASGQPEWIADASNMPAGHTPRAHLTLPAGLRSGAGIPVRAGDEVLAVLAFFKQESQPEDEHEVAIVGAVAAQLGTLIQRLRAEEEHRSGRAAAEASLRALNAELEARVAARTADLAAANAALRRTADELKTILGAFPDLFFRVDVDGRIIDYQAATVGDLYVPPAAFLGRTFQDVLPPEVSAALDAALASLRAGGGTQAVEYSLSLPGGERIFEARLVAVGAGEMVVVVRDMTERAQAEALVRRALDELEQRVAERTADLTQANLRLRAEVQERRRAEAALEDERALLAQRVAERTADLHSANAQLARASRLKDEFLANMSHELRTPLNAILGRAELLQEDLFGALNERQRHSVDVISESGQHLLALINDILDLSKIEAGKIDLHMDPVEIEELCEASLRLVRQAALSRQIKLSYSNHAGSPAIFADERRLKQVLVNLLSNAVKFTPEEGRVGLEVWADEAAGAISFAVWDSGIGIATEDLPRLFQPFVQLDSELNRRHEGTGLGLALVRRLMELHGGSVGVESMPGVGSRFTVTLPWQPTAEQPEPEPQLRAEARDGAGGGLILVADDNTQNVELLTGYLAARGFQVAVALTGAQAIEQARELRPDLILMDVQMPVLSGLEAMRALRLDPQFAGTPIIALTALAMAGDQERCLAAGATDYMAKPVALAVLLQRIRGLLRA